MRLFHTTDAAEAILSEGFRDGSGGYMLADTILTGVWLADSPLGINEGCKGEDVLAVDLPDDLPLEYYEVIEDRRGYREWCIPAYLINAHGNVTRAPDDD